ncbi:purine-binding chemotaxis protein CheW [Lachnospiraceae bacterium XBB2008]|nr:chemotaxis protein CheW [Lachnospiraceae bacterium]SCY65425.1 purine-binding chemotaxis protein CheW [Lachnospiraceae bacterium XBB2008]
MDELSTVSTSVQYIVVKLGEERFGINISYVDNIVRMQRMTRVPEVAPYIKGVINLRGEVVPVMSTRIKMGLEPDVETNATRIIILKFEQQGFIGFIVDAVNEVVTLGTDSIEKVADQNKEGAFVQGVGKSNDGLISILDLNALINDQV